MRKFQILLPLAILLSAGQLSTAGAIEAGSSSRLETYEVVQAPPSFRSACARYDWLCDNNPDAENRFSDQELRGLAEQANARVNRAVKHVSDRENHRKADHWTLPENGRGDCEDYVLAKMRQLLEAGVAPERLLTAIALYRRGENHAVLILRLDSGDLVLDNLTGKLRSPERTGYRFLAMQDSEDRSQLRVAMQRPSPEERVATVSSMTAVDPGPWATPAQR